MENLSNLLQKKKINRSTQPQLFPCKLEDKKDHFGKELSDWFGSSLYWVPKKFGRARVQRIFAIMQKDGDTNFTHLMNKIHHDK